MAPVALCVQIAQVELLLSHEFDRGRPARNFARHESLATKGAFVVEQDAIRRVQTIPWTPPYKNREASALRLPKTANQEDW